MDHKLSTLLDELVRSLTVIEEAEREKNGWRMSEENVWDWVWGPKWVKINCGHCGHFMVEKTTGELYNIQGYGRPDHNKKKKADIGNVFTTTADYLYSKRYNYLR